jgi:hypothetical protein
MRWHYLKSFERRKKLHYCHRLGHVDLPLRDNLPIGFYAIVLSTLVYEIVKW